MEFVKDWNESPKLARDISVHISTKEKSGAKMKPLHDGGNPFGDAEFDKNKAELVDPDWVESQVSEMTKNVEAAVLDLIGRIGVDPAHFNLGLTQDVLREVLGVLSKSPHELVGP